MRNKNRRCGRSTVWRCWLLTGLWLFCQAAQAQSYRFVFLGPKAPVVIEAQISAGKWDLRKIRQEYAAGVFERLDADHDKVLSPEEAARIPVTGRFSQMVGTLGEKWLELDTSPPDEQLSAEELAPFIDQALGPALSVVKAPPRLAQTVRLYAELDTNRDDRLTPEEFQQSVQRLRRSDFDDDETLSVAELQPYPLSVVQAQQMQAAENGTEMLLWLVNEPAERTEVAQRILDNYGSGQPLASAEPLGVPERFFKAFDTDKDNTLSKAELERYLEKAPSQVSLQVSLAPPQVQAGRVSPTAVQVKLEEEEARPRFNMAGLPVEFAARNRSSDASDQVNLFLTRAMTSDGDENKYLDQNEFMQLQAGNVTFTDVDLDANQQVTASEIKLFFTLDALAAQSRLVATVSDEAKVLFNLLDTQTDFRLTSRELADAAGILQQFDLDGDGALASRELASRLRVTFSQPELFDIRPNSQMNTGSRTGVVREENSGPLWFRRMDRNLDGDLSWREFLGTRPQFDQLDKNQDGLITLEEAEAAENLRN